MRLCVCTIQRNRASWLVEWVTFHHLLGVTDFIVYLHRCDDESAALVVKLSSIFKIQSFTVDMVGYGVQLSCFGHALLTFGSHFDWMAFIDGDEFIFPTRERTLVAALERYAGLPISALAVYWRCFGSSGHLVEPKGLLTEQFRLCSPADFRANKHVKSIVKPASGVEPGFNSHYFRTKLGTIDENFNVIHSAYDLSHSPTWEHLCINHYVTQSRQFYDEVKRASGAADAGPNVMRPESWWDEHDRNEECDRSLEHLDLPMVKTIGEVCAAVGLDPRAIGGLRLTVS